MCLLFGRSVEEGVPEGPEVEEGSDQFAIVGFVFIILNAFSLIAE